DLDRVAERYVAALEQSAGSAAVEAKIGLAVAAAAAETGVEPVLVAPQLAELGLLSANGRHGEQRGQTPLHREQRGLTPLRGVRPLWWLAGLYVAAVTIQLALALRVVSPWIMVDELVYSDMARSFARS